jgi:feruloyl esterase
MKILAAAALTVLVAAVAHSDAFMLTPASCDGLRALTLRDTVITSAVFVSAASYLPPGTASRERLLLPALCKVAATIKPADDSRIRIEVWMPVSRWNGKFQGVGNGGWEGSIAHRDLAAAVSRGYAAASTDTGHVGGTGSFAVGHPQKLVDFAYRAVHEMTVQGKAIVTAFYGSAPRLSYWIGCSSGGRQGLKEAQRFPDDYDGIVAGAAANAWTRLAASSVWIAQATLKNPASFIPKEKFAVLHRAVLDACDVLDGVMDGVIADPTQCHFDPQVLRCPTDDEARSCLTTAQVDAVRKIYSGPKNPRTRQSIFPGLEPGSELRWSELAGGPKLGASADDHFKYVVFQNRNWDFKAFDFDTDVAMTDDLDDGMINAVDANLSAFARHRGKLILYHGWTDQLIAPGSTVQYYTSVVAALGEARAAESVRLFMVPGMDHCNGGDGATGFDALAALEQWTERGQPPERITARHLKDGIIDRTRPLCPHPAVARYTGTGSTNDESNFVCKRP